MCENQRAHVKTPGEPHETCHGILVSSIIIGSRIHEGRFLLGLVHALKARIYLT
jgi:hypothetical protein